MICVVQVHFIEKTHQVHVTELLPKVKTYVIGYVLNGVRGELEKYDY